jgi:hypothetical protein
MELHSTNLDKCKKLVKVFFKISLFFILLQSIFYFLAVHNIKKFDNITDKTNQEIGKTYHKMQEAEKDENQKTTVVLFENLINNGTYESDLLAAGELEIQILNSGLHKHDSLTNKTIQSLVLIYEENLNFGLNNDIARLQKLDNCITIDLICNFIQKPQIDALLSEAKTTHFRSSQIKQYDIEHPYAFIKWAKVQGKVLSAKNVDLNKLRPTPGVIYVSKIFDNNTNISETYDIDCLEDLKLLVYN